MLSLLLTCRQDSKFLAKFVTTFIAHTKMPERVELLIFLDPKDKWNKELLEVFKDKVKVIPDTTEMHRGRSNLFYNELAKHATGEWLWYVCDDHFLFNGYDEYICNYIQENKIDSNKINVIAPMVENSGRISHILSKKFVDTIGFGQHGNVDSYINDTLEYLSVFAGEGKLPYVPPQPIMSDFSLDKELMKAKNKPGYDPIQAIQMFRSELMRNNIKDDARKLYEVMKGERESNPR
jgi:hypothetical protein